MTSTCSFYSGAQLATLKGNLKKKRMLEGSWEDADNDVLIFKNKRARKLPKAVSKNSC